MNVITIGRSHENDVVISDRQVSRHHLQIVEEDGRFRVIDFGSANGTFVDGNRIVGEVDIMPTSIIRIGHTTLPWQEYFQDCGSTTLLPQKSAPTSEASVPTRHGFVAFWLWLLIVANTGSCIYSCAFAYPALNNLGVYGMQLVMAGVDTKQYDVSHYVYGLQICSLVGAILSVASVVLLLKWRKLGFWMFVGASLVCNIINNMLMYGIDDVRSPLGISTYNVFTLVASMAGFVFGTLILYAVLQLKSNGVSAWKNLK